MIAAPEGSSQRLRFEPLVPAHVLSLSEALLDPTVYELIGRVPPKSAEALKAQIERWLAGPLASRPTERWWNLAVFRLEDNCGLGRLEATITNTLAEVAFLFGSKHWGNGYALEAMRWFQDRMAEDGSIVELWATVTPGNERSVRLLQRLGYTQIESGWPNLCTYDDGDLVFRHTVA